MMENNREKLLHKIQTASFSINDVNLYLDTHPKDRNALDFYQAYRAYRKQLVDEYNHQYGPMTVYDVKSNSKWTWAEGPWPWQMEE